MVKYKFRKGIYVVALLIIVTSQIAAFSNSFGSTYIGWAVNVVRLFVLFPIVKFVSGCNSKVYVSYVFTMLLGFLFHLQLASITLYNDFFEVLGWLVIIYILFVSKLYHSRIIQIAAICFFSVNCGIAFFEKITGTRLIEYDSEIMEGFVLTGDRDTQEFRAFGLLGHPLTNACVTSIFCGFILVNKSLPKILKFLLLSIGLLGLVAFNSRGGILIWILVLFYRFVLYDKSFVKTAIPLTILLFAYPFIMDWIDSGALGRFSFDFSDSSSATRWESFLFFAMQDWDLETSLLGGRYIKMPGTDLLLENGILLNLSYWGWLVGSLKTILEMIVSYVVMNQYDRRDRFIVVFAFWGVALTNNIITGMLPLTFFVFAYEALYVSDTITLKTKKYESII